MIPVSMRRVQRAAHQELSHSCKETRTFQGRVERCRTGPDDQVAEIRDDEYLVMAVDEAVPDALVPEP